MASEEDDKKMSFIGHLAELRSRLFRMAVAVLVVAIVLFIFRKELVDIIYMSMAKPTFVTYEWFCWVGHQLGLEDELCASTIDMITVSNTMTAQFSATILFALVGGIAVAFPFIAYQFWAFIKPALKRREIDASVSFMPYAILLFFLGLGFGYFIISPLAVQFFANWRISDDVINMPTITSYMSIITTSTFFTALLFELPILVLILSKIGIVTPELLRKYRRHAIVVVLIISAIITPPDFFSQIVVAVPIAILYEISIVVSGRVQKKRAEKK